MAQPGRNSFEDEVNSLYAFLVELHSLKAGGKPVGSLVIELLKMEFECRGLPVLPGLANAIRLLCAGRDNKAALDRAKSQLSGAPPALLMKLGYLLYAAQAPVFYSKDSSVTMAELTGYFNRQAEGGQLIASKRQPLPLPSQAIPAHDKTLSEGLGLLCRHVTSALKGAEAGDYSAVSEAIGRINKMEPKYASIPFISLARDMLNSSLGSSESGQKLLQLGQVASVLGSDKAAAGKAVEALKSLHSQACAKIEGFERAVSRLSELAARAGRAADSGLKGRIFSAREEARELLGRARPNSPERLLASALDAALSGMPPDAELDSAGLAMQRGGFLDAAQKNKAMELMGRIRRVRRSMLAFRRDEQAALHEGTRR